MTLRPLWGNVLIRLETPTRKTRSGLELPENTQQSQTKILQGTVVATGNGSLSFDGKLIPMAVNVGDKIQFKKYEVEEVSVDGEKLHLVDQRQIVALVDL